VVNVAIVSIELLLGVHICVVVCAILAVSAGKCSIEWGGLCIHCQLHEDTVSNSSVCMTIRTLFCQNQRVCIISVKILQKCLFFALCVH